MKKSSNTLSYTKKALALLQSKVGKIVTSQEFALIKGSKGKPISHNIRRIFELRDESGYNIVNHKDNEKTGLNLKVNEWVLMDKNPDLKRIRSRGVNKKIMYQVFSRDNYTCFVCGRIPEDDDPFKQGHKIKLHVGHIIAHKRENNQDIYETEKLEDMKTDHILTQDDFKTMCNICNEGAKNVNLKPITLIDRVKNADETTKKEIFDLLVSKFK